MTALERWMTAWDWEPSIVIGCAALAAGYYFLTRSRASSRRLYFFGGTLLLLLDLVSPLDRLGDEYLFSAHIVQHFILALIVPPLLLLRRPLIRWLEHRIGHPPVSWLLGVGAMLLWHVPVLFNAALGNDVLHVIQHLSFLVTGTVYWWPILAPVERLRLSVAGSVSYLFTACLSCSLLGAALTFGPPDLYPAYLHPRDSLGILSMIRDSWGLDARNDQQLGGLLMWVPGCFVYLGGVLWTLARWYGKPEYPVAEEPVS
jgi:cytochrome c oxidase assembly factor CtaG